jgi:phthiocerol/phenolphthiocerol synthesis type-I polyketide synthase E
VQTAHVSAFDAEALEAALAAAERRFGPLVGVIDATEMDAPRSFALMRDVDGETVERGAAEQASRLAALDVCLARRNPDFCLLMSSLAADVGGLGQLAHATAGLRLDALARRHSRGSPPWTVANWDVWRDPAQTAGAEGAPAALATTLASTFGMTPAEGAEAFARMLCAGPAARILVSAADPRLRREAARAAPATADAAGVRVGGGHARPDLPTPYEAPRTDDERAVAALWQEVLGVDGLGVNDNFFDLGGHSLLATQLLSRVQQQFRLSVELDALFQAPTIAQFAEILFRKRFERSDGDRLDDLLDRLDAMSDAEVEALLESGAASEELLEALAAKVGAG